VVLTNQKQGNIFNPCHESCCYPLLLEWKGKRATNKNLEMKTDENYSLEMSIKANTRFRKDHSLKFPLKEYICIVPVRIQ